jgi:hypothetical protein
VPTRHSEKGFKLGVWVSNLRVKPAAISEDRLRRVNELGFVWDALTDKWEEAFRHLQIYHAREGHCRVPVTHLEIRYRLGPWVSYQRLNREELTDDRCQRLDDLGFVWDILTERWEEAFSYLQDFHARAGHARVPKNHTEGGFKLGGWVTGYPSGGSRLSSKV